MFGVPLDGPTNALCDNDSVVKNSNIPSSTLKKKNNSICYHRVREAVASNILCIAYVSSAQNLVDMLTKPLSGCKLHELSVSFIIWDNIMKTDDHCISTYISFGGLVKYYHLWMLVPRIPHVYLYLCLHITYYYCTHRDRLTLSLVDVEAYCHSSS
jgi:hypothetical protein